MNGVVYIKSKVTQETAKGDLEKKWKRNAYPKSKQGSFLRKENNQWITGFNLDISDDEEEILKTKKPEAKFEILKDRKKLEKALGKSLEPTMDNEYLLHFRIPLCLTNNQEVKLNLAKPEDELVYRAAIAGGIVAPSLEDTNTFKYLNCTYYFSNVEEDASSQKKIAKIKNLIGGKIATFEENKSWLLSVSHALDLPSRSELGIEILYNQLDTYKNAISSHKDAQKVHEVFFREPLLLEINFIIDAALSYNIIKYSDDKNWVYDGLVLGGTKDEVKENLKKSQFAEAYSKIRTLINEKYKIK
jgi:hypothetical protein